MQGGALSATSEFIPITTDSGGMDMGSMAFGIIGIFFAILIICCVSLSSSASAGTAYMYYK